MLTANKGERTGSVAILTQGHRLCELCLAVLECMDWDHDGYTLEDYWSILSSAAGERYYPYHSDHDVFMRAVRLPCYFCAGVHSIWMTHNDLDFLQVSR